MGALSLTVIVGMGAFAVEATRGYAADTTNQRVADAAALAGALAYNVGNNPAQMTATAKAVVVAQGLPSSAADVQLVTDAETSKQLVQVTITTSVPLALGRVFTSALAYDVVAVGSATTSTVANTSPPCIAALDGSPANAISMNGGTRLSASGCAINSAAGISVTEGAMITASKQVNAGKAVSVTGGASITTSPEAGNIVQNKAGAAADWMADNENIKAILCQVNKLTGTSDPDYPDGNTACLSPLVTPAAVGTQDIDLNYSPPASLAPFRNGGTYVIPASYWAAYGNKIRNLTLQGGITATLEGPLTLSIAQINMGGGTHLHFGSGNISIAGKLDVGGGSDIDFDVGVGNTITIGKDGSTSINIGGGGKVCFTLNCVNPTAAAGTFSVGGDIVSQGGSTIVFPKAATHVIGGNLTLAGSSVLGSGKYIIAGYFTNNTGGTMAGADVTFALGGTIGLSGGTSLDLAAPSGTSSYGIPGVLFATKSSSPTSIGGGSNNRYSGLVYAPKSNMTISGGGAISTNGGACLMMILKSFTLTGGGNMSTGTCSTLSTSGSVASVALFK